MSKLNTMSMDACQPYKKVWRDISACSTAWCQQLQSIVDILPGRSWHHTTPRQGSVTDGIAEWGWSSCFGGIPHCQSNPAVGMSCWADCICPQSQRCDSPSIAVHCSWPSTSPLGQSLCSPTPSSASPIPMKPRSTPLSSWAQKNILIFVLFVILLLKNRQRGCCQRKCSLEVICEFVRCFFFSWGFLSFSLNFSFLSGFLLRQGHCHYWGSAVLGNRERLQDTDDVITLMQFNLVTVNSKWFACTVQYSTVLYV